MQIIEYKEGRSHARQLADEALRQMDQYGIAANPVNFAIWYMYLSQRIPELNAELDQTLDLRGTCTPEKSRELFQAFLADDNLDVAERTQHEALQLVDKLRTQSSEVTEAAGEYDRALSASQQRLQDELSAEDLQELIGPLREQTRRASERNQGFLDALQEARSEIRALQEEIEQTRRDASIDPLTSLHNRRALDQELDDCTSYYDEDKPVCLMVLDIDHFKRINDKHGHSMGDLVLAQTAQILKHCIGDDGYAARYGGEEFVVIVHDCPLEEAGKLAEKLRKAVSRLRITQRSSGNIVDNITISIGLTRLLADDDPETFFDRADAALYDAKSSGRNRVVTVTD